MSEIDYKKLYEETVKPVKHPVFLIQAATETKFIPDNGMLVYNCFHKKGFEFNFSLGGSAKYVDMDILPVEINQYCFNWTEQLGWKQHLFMGLCSCGTLYVRETCIIEHITHKDYFGPGNHMFYHESVRV